MQKQKIDYAKARFMSEAERTITTTKPELKGRFTALHIWEDLDYLRVYKHMTAQQAAEVILKTDYSTVQS